MAKRQRWGEPQGDDLAAPWSKGSNEDMLAFHYNNKLPSVADLLTEEQKAKAKPHNDWTQSDKSLKLVLDHILQSPQQLQKFKQLCQDEVKGLQSSSFPILRLDASVSAKEVMDKISKPPKAVKEAGAFVVQFAGATVPSTVERLIREGTREAPQGVRLTVDVQDPTSALPWKQKELEGRPMLDCIVAAYRTELIIRDFCDELWACRRDPLLDAATASALKQYLYNSREHIKDRFEGASFSFIYAPEIDAKGNRADVDEAMGHDQPTLADVADGELCNIDRLDGVHAYCEGKWGAIREAPSNCLMSYVLQDALHKRSLQRGGAVTYNPGINSEVGILSGPLVCAYLHIEDALAAALNYLHLGGFKLWKHANKPMTMEELVARPEVYFRTAAKQCSQEISSAIGKRPTHILQVPGSLVVTLPGWQWHHTCNVGVTLASATNWFEITLHTCTLPADDLFDKGYEYATGALAMVEDEIGAAAGEVLKGQLQVCESTISSRLKSMPILREALLS